MEEKYSWLGTVSAPQEYPMEVYSGAIAADDFTYGFDAIWGTQNTGWGNNGGTMSVTTKEMEIPHSLEFTYLSLVEKKMYTGKWNLDKEKISKLFKEGFVDENTQKKDTYKEFKIGLAPKGKVVLWIQGSGIQKEVGVFQAHDTIIKKEDAYDNAQYMFENNFAEEMLSDPEYKTFSTDVNERIKKFGYPDMNIYETYRKKYQWKPTVELPEGYQLKKIFVMTCNGEADVYKENNKERAIPFYMSLVMADTKGQEYGCNIFFTKDEGYYTNNVQKGNNVLPTDFDLLDIYKVFNQIDQKKEVNLAIKVNINAKSAAVDVQQGEDIYHLKDFITKIY